MAQITPKTLKQKFQYNRSRGGLVSFTYVVLLESIIKKEERDHSSY
jgi:hypothetical protein